MNILQETIVQQLTVSEQDLRTLSEVEVELLTEVVVSEQLLVEAEQGPPGADGRQGVDGKPGMHITGAVSSFVALPANAAIGEVWVTRDTGGGFAWTVGGWVDIGPIAIQGPAGAPGKDGQIRYTGHGAPGVIVGAEPGDTYLDLLSGEIYKLM